MEANIEAALFRIRATHPKDRITRELIQEIDKVVLSPKIRADKVWQVLYPKVTSGELKVYDIICFCIGLMQFEAVQYEAFKTVAIESKKILNAYHYLETEATLAGEL